MPEIKRYRGAEIMPHIPALADLRIRVFREFPYLYDGNLRYEEKYLHRYTQSDQTVVVLVHDGDKVVGASTGMPLAEEDAAVRKAFEQRGADLSRIFYFGESVLFPEYRGQGFGVRFFEEREAHALQLGYEITTFCAVDRAVSHPRRPAGYTPLDTFWQRRGYEKQPEMQAVFNWQDLDEDSESPKTLTFWIRKHYQTS